MNKEKVHIMVVPTIDTTCKVIISIIRYWYWIGKNHLPDYNTYPCIFLLHWHPNGWRLSKRRGLGRTIVIIDLFKNIFWLCNEVYSGL